MLMLLVFLFSGCSAEVTTDKNICHFQSFETEVPEAWESRGITDRMYSAPLDEQQFLLIGERRRSETEVQLAEDLALFFSGTFSSETTEFWTEYTADRENGLYTEGYAENENGNRWFYCGFEMSETDSFFFYFSKEEEGKAEVREYAEQSYESYRVL